VGPVAGPADPRTLPQRLADLRARARAQAAREPSGRGREWDRLRADLLDTAAEVGTATLGRAPWPTQLRAAAWLLEGHLVEMATGEGKSYAAALAAGAAALAGTPVHLMTANDYLVVRDAAAARPMWQALGLSVGVVTATSDPQGRRQAYACDITVCTAREVAFDYLRDCRAGDLWRQPLQRRLDGLLESETAPSLHEAAGHAADDRRPLLRGLHLAIVDEADGLLIDEGSMPLLLSERMQGPAGVAEATRQRAQAFQALGLARRLTPPRHAEPEPNGSGWRLTAEGQAELDRLTDTLGGVWLNRRHARDAVESALHALHGLHRDRDYVVRDGAVRLVDAVTGRAADGRVWSRGLQALVELKEGCALSPPTEVTARISLQRFFGRYLRLAGMSGTLTECRTELIRVFGLQLRVLPLRLPSRRADLGLQVFFTQAARREALLPRVVELHAAGRPVLIGTDSVRSTEAVCAVLDAAGLPHRRLDARHDVDEADVIALAGRAGAITVATQMAGRGTDITLAEGVAERGGLHVICCQDNPSARLDRQLIGRCARAGDPGSAEIWRCRDAGAWGLTPAGRSAAVNVADDHDDGLPRLVAAVVRLASSRHRGSRHSTDQGCAAGMSAPAWFRAWFRWRQSRHEASQARQRQRLLEQDLQWHHRTGSIPSRL
jgi:preprotein translocase subunit SecA